MTTPSLRSPNVSLIGVPGSRARLATPCLVLDLDVLTRNLEAMAGYARKAGRGLRPHFKSNKSLEIARRQMAAGAVGICSATIAEVEVLAAAGITGILLATPIVGEARLARLAALHAAGADVTVAVDHPSMVAPLARTGAAGARPLPVVVDFDVGTHRTGAATVAAAIALAGDVAAQATLRFAGVQAYAGHLQHVASFKEREELARAAHTRLWEVVNGLKARGLPAGIVTGAGTGTHATDAAADSPFTELQAGSYLFMDVDYERIELRDGANEQPFTPSLFVRSSVISANQPGMVTTDAGLKRFATDGPMPRLAAGAPEGSTYRFFGDEFGRVILPDGAETLPLGASVELVTPHCDPTVNLYDEYHVVRGDTLVAIWPVDARGLI